MEYNACEKKRTPSSGRRKKSHQVHEPLAVYRAKRRKTADNGVLPGFETVETTVPQSDVTYSVEAAFRRYGLEGADVFLAIAARCVQESHVRHYGFEFFSYERGLQVLDLVAHDRQVDSLLARICLGSDAIAFRLIPHWKTLSLGSAGRRC